MSKKAESGKLGHAGLTTKVLTLIPIAVGINLVGGTLCSFLKLPLFLDTIGTLIVACLAGPWAAALTGLLTNVFLAIVANPVYLPYAAVSVLVGLAAGFMARAGLFRKLWGVVLVWLVVTLVNSVSAAMITSYVFGGATGVNGTSVLTTALVVALKDVLLSVFSSALIENLVDKGIAVLIAYTVWRKIPKRMLSQYGVEGPSKADNEDVEVLDEDLTDSK